MDWKQNLYPICVISVWTSMGLGYTPFPFLLCTFQYNWSANRDSYRPTRAILVWFHVEATFPGRFLPFCFLGGTPFSSLKANAVL